MSAFSVSHISIWLIGAIFGYILCSVMHWLETDDTVAGPIAKAVRERDKRVRLRTAELIGRGYSLEDSRRINFMFARHDYPRASFLYRERIQP